MLTKELLINTINSLPEKFSLDDVMERMYVLNKIDIAREKSKAGKTYSSTEARKKMAKWLKSDGTKKR